MSLRKRILFLLFSLLFLLSSCTSTGLPVTDSTPSVTLPPAEVHFPAPIGDAALEYSDTVVFYLPSHDGISLSKVESTIPFSLVRPTAETIVRSLIAYPGSREAAALGGSVKLSLYGTNPVEVSRDVVTVNLSASALQLDREELFITCQAIANTLTELEEINHVNVLVVDKPIGLDIANTLPMGALQRNDESDLSAVYAQLLSRRAAVGTSDASAPFSASVPLYFPLQNSDGLICEVQTISFENQHMPDMVTAILREMAAGVSDSSILSPPLPLLADLLNATPVLTESDSAGGLIISLDFAHNLDDMLEAYGITRRQWSASVCYTLCSFFPNVKGVSLSISGAAVDSLMLTEPEESAPEAFLRSDFSSLIYDYATLYFSGDDHGTLVSTQRALPYFQCTNPRILLCELAKGPQPGDSRSDLLPVMKPSAITDTTILGLALSNHTLLTNFAPAFADLFETITPEEERTFTYAVVNTLCLNSRVRNVCFFLSGSQFDGFTGEIYWRGLFHPLPV